MEYFLSYPNWLTENDIGRKLFLPPFYRGQEYLIQRFVRTYKLGTLIIEIYNSEECELIRWGTVSGTDDEDLMVNQGTGRPTNRIIQPA